MIAAILFAVGFKGVSAVAGIFLVGGGYLGYRYGSKVKADVQGGVSKAADAVDSAAKKL